MRVRTLCLLAGTALPLILTGSAQAGFTGISTVSKPNPFGVGLFTLSIYTEFDRPGMLLRSSATALPMRLSSASCTQYPAPAACLPSLCAR